MFTKLAALALAVPAAGTAALLSADYVIVDVREHAKSGVHLTVPVPLTLVQTALSFAPEEARRVELPREARQHMSGALRLVEALRRQPDFELVRVEEADESVRVRKAGDTLEVDVSGRRGEDVHVRLPLSVAAEVLSQARAGKLRSAAIVDALRLAKGEIVHVHDGDTEVRVSVW
jgi:hypothetical protein